MNCELLQFGKDMVVLRVHHPTFGKLQFRDIDLTQLADYVDDSVSVWLSKPDTSKPDTSDLKEVCDQFIKDNEGPQS